MTFHRVIEGDVLASLRTLADGSVHCAVTSPPYWGLRDYGTATWEGGDAGCDHKDERQTKRNLNHSASEQRQGRTADEGKLRDGIVGVQRTCRCGARRIDQQIGLEPTPAEYVARMVEVFREVRRVLRDDGVLFLNIGDAYFGGGRGGGGSFDSERPGWREVPCGTSGKAPEGCRESDCLCGSLCGVCRAVYRRTTRTDPVLESMLRASLPDSIRECMESESDHLPTSDSRDREARTSTAIADRVETGGRDGEQLRALLSSTICESEPRLLDECLLRASRGGCLLCARSLGGNGRASEHMKACTCGTSRMSFSSSRHSGNGRSAVGALGSYGHSTTTYLKPKDLVGIPWLLAFALRDDGWYLRSDIIWSKPNPMPESVTDRPTKAHEYMFLMSKAARYYYDAEAVSEECGSFRTAGANNGLDRPKTPDPRKKQDALGKQTYTGFNDRYRDNPCDTRNRRTVWTIATQPYPEAHFATYPEALVEPCIKAGTSEKGCCPTCGKGWERVVDKVDSGRRQKMADGWDTGDGGHGTIHRNGREKGASGQPVMESRTLGFRPVCDHYPRTDEWVEYPSKERDESPDDYAARISPIVALRAELIGFWAGMDTAPCTVLDPFSGSGTTGAVAVKLGRNYIGIELNPAYVALSEKRIGLAKNPHTWRDTKRADAASLFHQEPA